MEILLIRKVDNWRIRLIFQIFKFFRKDFISIVQNFIKSKKSFFVESSPPPPMEEVCSALLVLWTKSPVMVLHGCPLPRNLTWQVLLVFAFPFLLFLPFLWHSNYPHRSCKRHSLIQRRLSTFPIPHEPYQVRPKFWWHSLGTAKVWFFFSQKKQYKFLSFCILFFPFS